MSGVGSSANFYKIIANARDAVNLPVTLQLQQVQTTWSNGGSTTLNGVPANLSSGVARGLISWRNPIGRKPLIVWSGESVCKDNLAACGVVRASIVSFGSAVFPVAAETQFAKLHVISLK